MTRPGFQIENHTVVSCDGIGFRNLLQAGHDWLELHLKIVNDLNVFPVPDGDTGINMLLTMRSVMEYMVGLGDASAISETAVAAAEGALMGGRGNSGVILSQFFKGLARALAETRLLTPQNFAVATQTGAEIAYQGVFEPVEGTILTVMRATSQAARRYAALGNDLTAMFEEMVRAAKKAQSSTPDLLPVLKAAGVTDSGGQGFVYILEGALRFLREQPLDEDVAIHAKDQHPVLVSPNVEALPIPEAGYGYDVQFLLHGTRLNVDILRTEIDKFGWSTLVVGNEHRVKVHIHTHDPGLVLSVGVKHGPISNVVVENLQMQAETFIEAQHREQQTINQTDAGPDDVDDPFEFSEGIGILAIVSGPGFARIFESLGATQVVMSNAKLNANMQDLLQKVQQVGTQEVIILPNSGNVILAAQHVRSVANQSVEIIPTRNMPQGIAALLAFKKDESLLTNAGRMKRALHDVQTIEITQVSLSSELAGVSFQRGDIVGMINNQVIAKGKQYDQVVLDILAKQPMDVMEIVTFYFGEEISKDEAETLGDQVKTSYPNVEIEIYDGGQPHYRYIIVLE